MGDFQVRHWADVSLVEETLAEVGEPKFKLSTENLRNAPERLMKFNGAFTTVIGAIKYL